MDLSFLIPSKVRRLVLDYFVTYPEAQVGIRELARELKISPQVTYRELVNLEGWGFLFSSRRGTQRAFRLNRKFPICSVIADLFQRIEEENSRKTEIVKVLDWKKLSKTYSKIPIPPSLIRGLTSKRIRPRAYDEEKILRKKGLL